MQILRIKQTLKTGGTPLLLTLSLSRLQGEQMPQISRFQAQAIGSRIYIHTHRSLLDILVLDVSDSDAPILSLQPVSSDPEPPMSRQAVCRLLCTLLQHYSVGRTPRMSVFVVDVWSVLLIGFPLTFDQSSAHPSIEAILLRW